MITANTITEDNLEHIPAGAFFIMWDDSRGYDWDEKFLNNPIGRAKCAEFYNRLCCPFKELVYETEHGDVTVAQYANRTDFADYYACFEE